MQERVSDAVLRPVGDPDQLIYSSRLVNLLLTAFISVVTLLLITTISLLPV